MEKYVTKLFCPGNNKTPMWISEYKRETLNIHFFQSLIHSINMSQITLLYSQEQNTVPPLKAFIVY